LLAHLALNQERYARTVRDWLEDPAAADPGGDPTEPNARMAEENRDTPVDHVVATFDASVRELVSVCDLVDEQRMKAAPLGRWPFVDVLASWSRHHSAHAIDLVSALPEFKTDPVVLNWVLHFDFSGRPEWSAWQLKLITEVREMFHLRGEEDS
jgi:hypothetical protein